jgi:hypothetical protein
MDTCAIGSVVRYRVPMGIEESVLRFTVLESAENRVTMRCLNLPDWSPELAPIETVSPDDVVAVDGDNTAHVTLRPVVVHGAIAVIVATYTWVTGPLSGRYDGLNYTDWSSALAALARHGDMVSRVYVRGANSLTR